MAEYLSASQRKAVVGTLVVPANTQGCADLVSRYLSTCSRLELTRDQIAEATTLVPDRLNFLLKAGAVVGACSAWDAELKKIEFLTTLRLEDLNRTLWKISRPGFLE
ncbi:MAG: hypothetical protein EOP06_23170 [Proteobacteria bacterium]|nr:MAG: hypothetical protein EOP06_23170 [Pseudomonadota bacterium]